MKPSPLINLLLLFILFFVQIIEAKTQPFFKFKKNVRAKQKIRINALIDSTGFNDSIKNIRKDFVLIEKKNKLSEDSIWKNYRLVDERLEALSKKHDSLVVLPFENKDFPKPLDVAPVKIQIESDSKEKRANVSLIRNLLVDSMKTFGNKMYKLHKNGTIHLFYKENSLYDTSISFKPFDVLVYDELHIDKAGNLKLLSNNYIIDKAKRANCKIYFTVDIGPSNINKFLADSMLQKVFINNAVNMMSWCRADGININFLEMRFKPPLFTAFIKRTSVAFKKNYDICVTLPPVDKQGLYDIKTMNPFVTTYYIDFTIVGSKSSAAPLAPAAMYGNNINTSILYYTNADVNPDKLIVKLPYYGAGWKIYAGKKIKDEFTGYYSYSSIQNYFSQYDKNPMAFAKYDNSLSAFIDDTVAYNNKVPINRIWFDNENTLAQKYDMIIDNKLGGVGISYLGDDGKYGELTSILLYKFYSLVIAPVKDVKVPKKKNALNWWQKIGPYYYIFKYILNNPCDECLNEGKDSAICLQDIFSKKEFIDDSIATKIDALRIDSIVKVKNKSKNSLEKVTRFSYINDKMKVLVFYVSIFFTVLFLVTVWRYLYQLKNLGDTWKHQELLGWVLLILSVMFISSFFALAFVSNGMTWFGASDSDRCVDIPLFHLFVIIWGCLVLGAIVGRVILTRLKKQDLP